PDEEVGREERAEHHHLGDDEKQHPEQLGLDARTAVCGRRPVVLVVLGVPVGDGGGFHGLLRPQAAVGASAATCSTGFPDALRTRSMRSVRIHPERVSGRVEITMSSTRKDCTPFIVAVYGSGSLFMLCADRTS